MLGGLIAVAVLSGLCAHMAGYAFVAPSDSFLRARAGGFILAASVLLTLAFPPILAGLISGGAIGTWPPGLGPDTFRALWVVLSAAGLLSGLRVWRMRFRRDGARMFTLDESPFSRVQAQLPLADSLDAALDVLGREAPAERDIGRLADVIRAMSLRFWHQLPEKDSEVYNMVRTHVPPEVAAEVTRLLLEGAQRKPRG